MPIVTSEAIVDTHTQPDSSRYVWERHVDNLGIVYQIGPYLAPAGFDIEARLASRASALSDQLAEAEALALADDGV